MATDAHIAGWQQPRFHLHIALGTAVGIAALVVGVRIVSVPDLAAVVAFGALFSTLVAAVVVSCYTAALQPSKVGVVVGAVAAVTFLPLATIAGLVEDGTAAFGVVSSVAAISGMITVWNVVKSGVQSGGNLAMTLADRHWARLGAPSLESRISTWWWSADLSERYGAILVVSGVGVIAECVSLGSLPASLVPVINVATEVVGQLRSVAFVVGGELVAAGYLAFVHGRVQRFDRDTRRGDECR